MDDSQAELQRLRAELAVSAAYRYAAEKNAVIVASLQQQLATRGWASGPTEGTASLCCSLQFTYVMQMQRLYCRTPVPNADGAVR
jgi:hypothetical protein